MNTVPVRRLSAIVALDVVGYSRMMGEDEQSTLSALRWLRNDVLSPAVAVHGGRIIKSLGDGWLVSFDSAAAAVRSAADVQASLTDDTPMRLRIGVHLGDVTFEDEDIYGDGVNIAARLEALAAPGGLAISDTVWSSLDGTMQSQFTDCGLQHLKNIANPVRIWSQGGTGQLPDPGGHEASDPAGTTSIAITPFATSGENADLHALADGMAEDLEAALARFRSFDVVQHTDNTRARYLLGGAVRGSGQRVRVTAHLTYTPNGRRLWSERWDRTGDDLFALQDELTGAVVAAASPEIDAHEKALIGTRPVHTLTARELSLRTNAILSSGVIDELDEAEALTMRAISLEPENPDSYSAKSLVAYRKACSGAWPPHEQLDIGLEAAREALRLDQRQASAYGMASVIYAMRGETSRALDAADRVTSLNPNAWGAPHGRTVALAFAPTDWVTDPQAHADDMLRHAEETLHMAPSSGYRSGHLFFRGLAVLMRDEAADLSAAINALDQSATEPGATWWPSLFLALAELRRGNDAVARDRISDARTAFAALSLSGVQALFGRSYVGSRWQTELERLPDIGLPRD